MAQVTLHRPQNMLASYVFYGSVQEASAGRLVVSDGHRTVIYEGAFAYTASGALSGGNLAAVTYTTPNTLEYVATGLSVNAVVAADLINRGDSAALLRIALGGDDIIQGSTGSDTLVAHDGNDVLAGNDGWDILYGGAGRDLLLGGASSDELFGGDGVDTAGTAALRRQATVQTVGGSLRLNGPEGLDGLYSIEAVRLTDGTLYFGPDSFGAGVHRLYLAALGRPADAPGLGNWTTALEAGAVSVQGVAAAFTGSAEFAQRYGAPDTDGFVNLLYANVLGRAPDAAGFAGWIGALNGGALTRQEVVLGFSDSAEFKTKTAPALANGLWAPDPAAVDVLRVYLATLDRLPDAGGLAAWTNAHQSGLTTQGVEAAFIGSAEFGAKYGATGNAAFVDLLYRNVFDRAADAGGMAFWGGGLDAGRMTRADVVHGLAFSDEMTARIAPFVSEGIAFA